MAAPHVPSAEDVAEAMAMTFEREDAAGAPWCPPHDAAVLRRWITDRSRQLGGGMRRVVRLARLARLADGRDYIRFLYVRVPALRTRHFETALRKAVAEGRLTSATADMTANGVRLKEPALTPIGAAEDGFEIDHVQMPRLAALLDVLHNSLGYVAVADLLAPLLVAGPPAVHADEVARALQSRFNAWLSERLGSVDHMRQAQTVRAFLASRGQVEPEAVDDEAIVSFWTEQATTAGDGDVAGFRLYRSAARALLRYRAALRDALAEAQIRAPLALEDRTGNPSADLERIEAGEWNTGAWRSPLLVLAAPPANAIKWLTGKERLQLLNYLGGPRPDDEPADAMPEAEADDEAIPDTDLSGGERFDLRFIRTLLRVDVFGAAQSSIVGRLRKRVAAPAALAQVLAPIGETAYDDCAAAYAALREQLQVQSLAALVALMEAGAAEALILLRHFGGQDAVDAVVAAARGNVTSLHAPAREASIELDDGSDAGSMIADRLVGEIAPALSAAAARPDILLPEATRDLIAQAHVAARKVNRLGFRREDRADPGMLLSLRSAIAAVIDLLAELDRLEGALAITGRREQASADRALFAAAFDQIYCAAVR